MTEQLQLGQTHTSSNYFLPALEARGVYVSQANRRQPPEIHTRQMVLEAG